MKLRTEGALLLACLVVGAMVPVFAGWANTLTASQLSIIGVWPHRRVFFDPSTGGRAVWMFDDRWVARFSAGIFPDNRLVMLVFGQRDNGVNPKIMLRTDHENENGMLFLKNEADQHRIDMGLDIDGPDENAYLVYWNSNGKKRTVFGSFPYVKDQNIRSAGR